MGEVQGSEGVRQEIREGVVDVTAATTHGVAATTSCVT